MKRTEEQEGDEMWLGTSLEFIGNITKITNNTPFDVVIERFNGIEYVSINIVKSRKFLITQEFDQERDKIRNLEHEKYETN